jgi:hypothetical protein
MLTFIRFQLKLNKKKIKKAHMSRALKNDEALISRENKIFMTTIL